MNSLAARSVDEELMDDLKCQGEVVDQTLRELDTINRWLGGNRVTISGLQSLLDDVNKGRTLRIADIGCGSGEMTALIAKWALNSGRKVETIGIDANPHIIDFAIRNTERLPGLSFKVMNVLDKEFEQQKFDAVVATLFMHHFTSDQLIGLFRRLREQTKLGFVVNDIHRHAIAFHSIRMLTSLLSKSTMVKFDAPLSVRRAFTRPELEAILAKAAIENYSLKWRWAFRWQVVIRTGSR